MSSYSDSSDNDHDNIYGINFDDDDDSVYSGISDEIAMDIKGGGFDRFKKIYKKGKKFMTKKINRFKDKLEKEKFDDKESFNDKESFSDKEKF